MKKYFTFLHIYILLAFVVLISCRKIEQRSVGSLPSQEMINMMMEEDSEIIHNYVWLTSDQNVSYNDTGFKISALAAFTDSITNGLDQMQNIKINNRTIQSNSNYTFDFKYSDSSTNALDEGLDLSGSNVSIKITGASSADTITSSIYMPKKVFTSTGDYPIGKINRDNNLTLKWVADANNPTGNVMIKIWYHAASNRFLNGTNLPANDTTLTFIVSDNGTYTISSASLHAFSPNSYVEMAIGRGTQIAAHLPISLKRVFIFATASVTTPLLLITESCPGCTGANKKCINGVCETGTKICWKSTFNSSLGMYVNSYRYEWSDNSISPPFNENSYCNCSGSQCL